MNDSKLIFQPLNHLGIMGTVAITPIETDVAQAPQIGLFCVPFWHREHGQMVSIEFKIDLTHLSDLARIVHRLRHFAKEAPHFRLRS